MSKTFGEMLDAYIEQEQLYNFEGRKGIEVLAKIAGALGYKDSTYYGQLTNGASLGDLLAMLEDNSGMVEAMIEWLKSRNFSEFRDKISEHLHDNDDDGDPDEWTDN